MKKGLVSVLLPVYNGEIYLLDMLNSIFNQDYRPIELIIGDDCSSDKSINIILEWRKKYEKEDFSIFVIQNKENIGLAQNISHLSKKINGEYIFLADQDDVWYYTKISEQVKYLTNNEKCMVCLCDRTITNSKLQILINSEYTNAGYKLKTMSFMEVIKHLYCYASNCMAIRNIGNISDIMDIPKGIIMHDLYITVIASQYGTVDFLYKPLVYYRIHRNNLSGNYSAQFSDNIIKSFINTYRKSKRIKQSQNNDNKVIGLWVNN